MHPRTGKMESTLKRVLDFKLVFESLCEGNGMIRLETLTTRWPNRLTSSRNSGIPEGCVRHWKSCAGRDGYLDWDKFSTGLQLALKEEGFRISQDSETELPQSEAERKLRALRRAKKENTDGLNSEQAIPLTSVSAEEIEMFLNTCSRDKLTKTLTRLRKDHYKGQLSIHRLTTSSTNSPVKKQHAPKMGTTSSEIHSTKVVTTSDRRNTSVGILNREKEELTQGLETLEKTKQWYSDRLNQLAQEESKKVQAEELLVVLERGTSTKSEMMQHLKEINTHLESLASPAPELTREQKKSLKKHLQKLSEVHRERDAKRQEGVPAIGDAVVEWNQDEQQSEILLDTRVNPSQLTFPVELKNEKPTGTTNLSLSMLEIRQTNQSEYEKERVTRRKEHRYGSSQNVSTRDTREHGRHYAHHRDSHHDQSKRRVPKRSHSFTNTGTKSNPRPEFTNSVTDYPISQAQKEASLRPNQQYPLRETASMQELPGGHRTASSVKPIMHGNKPLNQSSIKSSSVRNIPSSTGNYGNRTQGTLNPGLMHQQVYSSGMSYSTQTLPSSYRHHAGSIDPKAVRTTHTRTIPNTSQRRGTSTSTVGEHTSNAKSSYSQQTSAPGKLQSGHRQNMGDSMLSLV